jgi:hypothetical protein
MGAKLTSQQKPISLEFSQILESQEGLLFRTMVKLSSHWKLRVRWLGIRMKVNCPLTHPATQMKDKWGTDTNNWK